MTSTPISGPCVPFGQAFSASRSNRLWMFSQNSGETLKNLPSLKAMSGEMRPVPFISWLTHVRSTPIAIASALGLMSISLRKSSFRISPGVSGNSALLFQLSKYLAYPKKEFTSICHILFYKFHPSQGLLPILFP